MGPAAKLMMAPRMVAIGPNGLPTSLNMVQMPNGMMAAAPMMPPVTMGGPQMGQMGGVPPGVYLHPAQMMPPQPMPGSPIAAGPAKMVYYAPDGYGQPPQPQMMPMHQPLGHAPHPSAGMPPGTRTVPPTPRARPAAHPIAACH